MSSLCPGCLNRRGCTRQCRLCAGYRSRLAEEAVPHQDPPMSQQLAAEIREALARVERAQVVDLGSFAEHADDDS